MIDHGVHIYVYGRKKYLNRTLKIDSPFRRWTSRRIYRLYKKSVQCTPNMVCYICPIWNTLYGVKLHQIFGVCFPPNWVCFHTNSVCFPTNFSVFSHFLWRIFTLTQCVFPLPLVYFPTKSVCFPTNYGVVPH